MAVAYFIMAIAALAAYLYAWAGMVYGAIWMWMKFCLWMLPSNHPKLTTYFPTKEAIQ